MNTKHHRGAKVWVGRQRMLVNGHKADHLRNARFEADRVRRVLSDAIGQPVEVTPVITMVGVGSITVRDEPSDVIIARSERVARWLRGRATTLDPVTTERIAEAILDRDVWGSADDGDPTPAFKVLQSDVARARALARGWFVAGSLAAVSAALAIGLDSWAQLLSSLG